jgi:multimeric flavodoxin WrbA
MKVTAFNGSPRIDGNTSDLIKKVLEPIKAAGIDTEVIQLGGSGVHPCRACFKCGANRNRRCAIIDDKLNEWIEKIIESNAIIIGSPTYFAGVTPETKALIDRAGFVAKVNGDLFSRKIGAAVSAVRRGGAVDVMSSINKLFLISQMIIPGSTYWNFGFGMNKGEVENDSEGLANMKNLGENILWLLNKIC